MYSWYYQNNYVPLIQLWISHKIWPLKIHIHSLNNEKKVNIKQSVWHGQTDIKHEKVYITVEDRSWKASFQTRSLQGRKLFNCNLQQWHSAKCLHLFMFYICLSVCHFAKGNVCRIICTLFCLVDIKKRSFLSSCVFCYGWTDGWIGGLVEEEAAQEKQEK